MTQPQSDREARCPECGACRVDGADCAAMLGLILAWEWDDPDLLREHFLTVAVWNLQHPARFTDEAIDALRAGLVAYLDEGATTAQLRQRASDAFEGARRVRKDPTERRPVPRAWDMTVADVVARGPAGAAERVREWAERVKSQEPGGRSDGAAGASEERRGQEMRGRRR